MSNFKDSSKINELQSIVVDGKSYIKIINSEGQPSFYEKEVYDTIKNMDNHLTFEENKHIYFEFNVPINSKFNKK